MHWIRTLFSLITVLPRNIFGQDCDLTTFGGPQVNQPCVFPFIFNSNVYNRCTNDADPDGKVWCSTKTDRKGVHVGGGQGHWGYCKTGCGQPIERVKDRLEGDEGVKGFAGGPDADAVKFGNSARTTLAPISKRPSFTTQSKIFTPRPVFRKTTLPPTTATTNNRVNLARINPSLVTTSQNDDPSSGLWLPSSERQECGFRTNIGYIFGRERAARGEFPFAALLGYQINGRVLYLCGGTLINKRYVLTAAHCQGDKPIREVVIGEYDAGLDPDCEFCSKVERMFIDSSNVIVHENWNPRIVTGGNDIALIRLPRLATTIFDDSASIVVPACLNWRSEPIQKDNLIVVGWGKVTNSPRSQDLQKLGIHERTLQKLTVPLLNTRECEAQFRRRLDPFYICAGGLQGQDSCNGDSGGALISRTLTESNMFLIGIVAFGSPDCGLGIPGAYTNVENYIAWIRSHLRP